MTHRVAVLGTGVGAEHVAAYLALPERFEVVQICGLDAAAVGTLAAQCGAQAISDIARVLDDPDVEIVDICLPPKLHGPVARDALQAGKHVIVEKPLTGTLNDADALAATAAASSGRLFPVFQYRYGAAFAVLRALDRAGLLGPPQIASLETHWNRDAAYYSNGWRGTWAAELGGAVLTHAIHIHDLLTQSFGPVAEVTGLTATRINPIETEDCAALALRLRNGALASSSITLGAAEDSSRLRLIYRDATVESARAPYHPGGGDWRYTARDPAQQSKVDAVVAATPAPAHSGFAGFLAAVSEALEGRGEAVSLADGVASIELASAIYHAARTGTRVSLPLDRSLPICAGLGP